ncbi:MAG: hypothetical protein ACREC0_00230 [Methylocella sp.]
MTDYRAIAVDWVLSEFEVEQRNGFSTLKRVPDTRVIRFLDHFANLNSGDQSELAAILAEWSSYKFSGTPIAVPTVDQFTRATVFPGRAEGLRYMGIKLLAGLAKGSGHGELDDWFRMRGITGLALQPPENLVRDASDLIPVRIPTIRRVVQAAFAKLFAPNVTEIGGGIWRFEGMLGESSLKVMIRYSGKMGRPQLKYEVAVRAKGRVIAAPNLCLESVLGAGFGGWDYLTEENAVRSVALLCELVEYVARLPERLPDGCCQEEGM